MGDHSMFSLCIGALAHPSNVLVELGRHVKKARRRSSFNAERSMAKPSRPNLSTPLPRLDLETDEVTEHDL